MNTGTNKLRLYVAGYSPNSARARENLQRLVAMTDPGEWQVEVVDVLERPEEALRAGAIITPMLYIDTETSSHQVVGSLSDQHLLRELMGIEESGS